MKTCILLLLLTPLAFGQINNGPGSTTPLNLNTIPLNPQVGTISLPTDFINTGITFTRDAFGNYSTSFNPDTYYSGSGSGTFLNFTANAYGVRGTGACGLYVRRYSGTKSMQYVRGW